MTKWSTAVGEMSRTTTLRAHNQVLHNTSNQVHRDPMDASIPDRLTETEAYLAWRSCVQGHGIAAIAQTIHRLGVSIHDGELNAPGDEFLVAEVLGSLISWAVTQHAYWVREGRLQSAEGRALLVEYRASQETANSDVTGEIGDFLSGS